MDLYHFNLNLSFSSFMNLFYFTVYYLSKMKAKNRSKNFFLHKFQLFWIGIFNNCGKNFKSVANVGFEICVSQPIYIINDLNIQHIKFKEIKLKVKMLTYYLPIGTISSIPTILLHPLPYDLF